MQLFNSSLTATQTPLAVMLAIIAIPAAQAGDFEVGWSQRRPIRRSGETTHRYTKADGSVIYDLDPETRAAVQKEYDQKIEKIREMAEYQCKFIK